MSLMSPADTVPMALGFNPTDDGDEIEGNLWKSTYGLWIYIYIFIYIIIIILYYIYTYVEITLLHRNL